MRQFAVIILVCGLSALMLIGMGQGSQSLASGLSADTDERLNENGGVVTSSPPITPTVTPSDSTDSGAVATGQNVDGRLLEPPAGASHHPGGMAGIAVTMPSGRVKRSAVKPGVEGLDQAQSSSGALKSSKNWKQLSFSSGSFTPESGIDPALSARTGQLKESGRNYVYGFLLMDEFLSRETRAEIEALGVVLLGPHSSAQKVKIPLDSNALEQLSALSYVEWVGLSTPVQKMSIDLKQTFDLAGGTSASAEFPVVINLFEDDFQGDFKRALEEAGVIVGSYNPSLYCYHAVVDPQALDRITDFDFVLFIELMQGDKATHNQSMPLIGADYIRTGGSGTNYDGSSVTLGICDTGFMLGGAAPTMHWDLNKNGCGINFTSDAAGVWNDENGHGTHVLATISGTGTGQSRYRGFATGLGGAGATRIRAAKIWRSTGGSPDATWMINAMNYMDDETSCDNPRPDLVSISGGGYWGSPLAGTDERSRTLDNKVWSYKQLYVIAAGNDGSGVSTVGAPAVAKNALAVGNVRDYDYLTVGDIWTSSSRGPTADGRMKPNLVAPGRWVTSAQAGTTNGYTSMSGTSMATPHVSGLAATLMDHYSGFKSNPALARAYLMASSILHDDNTTPVNNSSGGRNDYGLGRVSTYVSHWAMNNSDGWTGHWTSGGVDDDTYLYRDVTVPTGTARLVVVMTWDEPAASAGASDAVLYDLDLWIDRDANCSATLGRCGEYGSFSRVDNVEYRIIENPPAGTYRLKATPWDAPSSDLPVGIAAVVIRGDPTPNFTIGTTSSTTSPCLGQDFTITTNITPDSYILSGAHLALTSLPSGVTLQNVSTVREDNINMDFGTATQFTLGNIRADDTRSVVWRFRAGTSGSKTFSFRVWSENGGTKTRNTSVTAVGTPGTPSSISYPTNDCDGTFTVSWTTASSATSYTLQRATNSSFSGATTVYTGSSTSYSQTGLSSGTYYYRVRGVNNCSNGSWKNGGAMSVSSAPAAPSSISYNSSDCDGSFAVSWASSSLATSYSLQRATNSSFTGATTVYAGGSTSYSQTGLAQGSYYYRVRATNSCGNSGWRSGSLIKVISTPSAPATITYASTDCDGTFTVSWASVSTATKYVLQRAAKSNFFRCRNGILGIRHFLHPDRPGRRHLLLPGPGFQCLRQQHLESRGGNYRQFRSRSTGQHHLSHRGCRRQFHHPMGKFQWGGQLFTATGRQFIVLRSRDGLQWFLLELFANRSAGRHLLLPGQGRQRMRKQRLAHRSVPLLSATRSLLPTTSTRTIRRTFSTVIPGPAN